ncbi:MAG: FkbM family methyltransferase, partial [Bacteroidota bacterium]
GFFKALAGFGRSMNRLYENRNHDPQSNGEGTVLSKLARFSPGVIIDAGANVGKYAKMAHRICPDATIYAFEPVPSTFQRLVDETDLIPAIHPVCQGLYSRQAHKSINLFDSHTHSSLYDIQGINYAPTQQQTIDLVRGDDFLAQAGIDQVDFLKMDVEGAEYEVLLGFEESLKKGQITAIQFEYGYINISTKRLLIDFYQLLESHGYRVGKIFPKQVEFRPYAFKYEDFIGPNFLAVKTSASALLAALASK